MILFYAWALCFLVWLFYLVVMQLKQARDAGLLDHPVVRFHAVLVLALGVLFYAALNIVVATVVFLDPPREFEFTKRCRRYIAGEGQWFPALAWHRAAIAEWICYHLLDPFEEGGHC